MGWARRAVEKRAEPASQVAPLARRAHARVGRQRRVQPDCVVALRGAGDVLLEGVLPHVDGHVAARIPARGEKRAEPAPVVVVTVGDHRQVRLRHVHAERPRVGKKAVVGAHVKEDAATVVELQPQAESVTRRQPTRGRAVLHQYRDAHGNPPAIADRAAQAPLG